MKTSLLHFVGIDPGLKGAICILDNELRILAIHDMPVISSLSRICGKSLLSLLRPYSYNSACCIELVGYKRGDGGKGIATFMHGAGLVEGVCTALGMEVVKPRPQLWRAAYPGMRGKGKGYSVRLALSLMSSSSCNDPTPSEAVVAGGGEILPYRGSQEVFTRHDQAEAYLLARFAWLNRGRWGELQAELNGQGVNGQGVVSRPRLRGGAKPGHSAKTGRRPRPSNRADQDQDQDDDTGALVI